MIWKCKHRRLTLLVETVTEELSYTVVDSTRILLFNVRGRTGVCGGTSEGGLECLRVGYYEVRIVGG